MPKIIATLGPASCFPNIIQKLEEEGVTIFRLNFSHGSHEWHANAMELVRHFAPKAKILLDTKGPEVRTGDVEKPIEVTKDDSIVLVTEENEQNFLEKKIFVSHKNLPQDVAVGDRIALDSGLIELEVLETKPEAIITRALHSGKIGSRRHVNLIGKDVSLPTLTETDLEDIVFGAQHHIDFVALSFCRTANAVKKTKKILEEAGHPEIKIIAKIESALGLKNLEEIVQTSDGVMVARGDLGVETPVEEVPYAQERIIEMAKKYGKMSIVATEMLESMIEKPRPTRAEVSDIALASWQGSDYVMLSGETAGGKYPVECVQTMQKILKASKKHNLVKVEETTN